MKKPNNIAYFTRLRYGYYQFFDHFLGRKFFFKITAKGRRRFYKKLEKNLKARGKGTLTPVQRVDTISRDDFVNNYVKKGIPLIINKGAENWGCVKNWSLEYFKDLHGDDEIVFMDQTDTHSLGYEETTLGEVIDDIRGGKGKYYRFYPLLDRHPEHLLDFDYEWLQNHRTKKSFGNNFHVFISGSGGFTPIHNASSHNIFTQVYGEKKWVLYPMDATCIIDPPPCQNMYRSAPVIDGNVCDPFEKKFDHHKLYEYINGYSAHLKPGDIFYNPPYMWHSVKNPTDSIGVGYRFFTPIRTYVQHPLYMFLELFAFNPPIWKTWSNYAELNLIHLAETGKLEELKKKRGVKKINSSVK